MIGPYDTHEMARLHNAELQQNAADYRLEMIARSARRRGGAAAPGMAERGDAALFAAATAIHWLGGLVRLLTVPRVHFRAR